MYQNFSYCFEIQYARIVFKFCAFVRISASCSMDDLNSLIVLSSIFWRVKCKSTLKCLVQS